LSEKKKSKDHHKDGELKPRGEVHVEVKGEEKEPEKIQAQEQKEKAPEGEKKEPTPQEKLQGQLAEKTREAAENYDKWLRLLAEFDNFKKRTQKEKADLMKFGNESLLRSILPILDNLERAINHGKGSQNNSSLLEGLEITLRQFLNTLERFGVKPLSARGEVFDPEKHEAVSQQESDQEPNRVISEIEKGYIYQDRLLRPARVIVSKEKAAMKTEGS
jgi:molecular chaperone GrpE